MKKRFVFPLEGVLKLRRRDAEAAQQQLARAEAAVRKQERLVQLARQRLEGLVRQPSPTGGAGPAALRRRDAFRREAQQAYEGARQRLAVLLREAEDARRYLVHKRQEEESLQTLHDRQRAAHTRAQETAEAAFMDEQALSGFHRRKKR